MKIGIALRLAIISLLFLFSTANAAVWYVHPDLPLNSIQGALNNCADNDTVLVGPGIYDENIDWPNTEGIDLISEYGPDTTIIDGTGTGRVISIITNVWLDTTTIISGFTIRNGYSVNGGGIYCWEKSNPKITNNIIIDNVAIIRGGGIYCDSCPSPTISNNTITGNVAVNGGGIYCYCSYEPTITDNSIIGNTACAGGGIYCFHSYEYFYQATITRNIITDNIADSLDGGGIYCSSSSPIIDSCTISCNIGDGIYCSYSSSPVINYNNITDNTGYGVRNVDPSVTVNAEYNWWGDITGPYHPITNPGGLGDTVSYYVDFIPWLTEAGIEETTDEEIFFISQGKPNPFLDKTLIEYQLPKDCNVHISIYNTLGARIRTLLNERRNAGYHTITWDGRDKNGKKLPSGFYFLRLEAGDYKGTRKLLLIK